jgi:hypothetical protein
MNFKLATSELDKSASRAISALCTKFCDAGGMSYEVFTALYNSLLQPILSYGAGLWGLTEHSHINTVQNRACRFFLSASATTSTIATRGDMGWTSCLTKQRLEVYRHWFRLTYMSVDRLPAVVHVWSSRHKRS